MSAGLPRHKPDLDLRPTYVAHLHRNWQFWQGKAAEFEVLTSRELRPSDVSLPDANAPVKLVIGSPVFVAVT
jgi:hypothetical protein